MGDAFSIDASRGRIAFDISLPLPQPYSTSWQVSVTQGARGFVMSPGWAFSIGRNADIPLLFHQVIRILRI